MQNPLVSIIVNNHNYAEFLPAALESALSQSYAPCEVVVVDDGSSDGSREVIEAYRGEVRAVFQPNAGQAAALNAGFEECEGEIVLFLDADDVLLPRAVERVVKSFQEQPGMSRVQFRMEVVDAQGRPTGELKPAAHIPIPTGDIRHLVLRQPFDLPWLPTSGNAFSAAYLREVLPIPAEEYGQVGADYYLVHLAPLYGPVGFVRQVGAYYRKHGSNRYEPIEDVLDLEHLRQTIRYEQVTYSYLRAFAQRLGIAESYGMPERNRSVASLANRLISKRLDGSRHPVPGDSTGRLVLEGVRAAAARQDLSILTKTVFFAWFLSAGFSPRPLLRWLALTFLYPERRAKLNQWLGRQHQRTQNKTQVEGFSRG